jgi:hypothetical protein
MKRFALTALLIAGCATTNLAAPGPDATVKELAAKKRAIANRAKQCVATAIDRGRDEMREPAGFDSTSQRAVQIAKDKRDREIAKCKATEGHENEELSAQERNEYMLQAEQERDRNSLIMILSTSSPH